MLLVLTLISFLLRQFKIVLFVLVFAAIKLKEYRALLCSESENLTKGCDAEKCTYLDSQRHRTICSAVLNSYHRSLSRHWQIGVTCYKIHTHLHDRKRNITFIAVIALSKQMFIRRLCRMKICLDANNFCKELKC